MSVVERHQKREEPHSAIPYVLVWGALLVLTVVTFTVAKVHLGPWNLAVAMLIATVKAGLVLLVFMHLKQHAGANQLVFGMALSFVALLLGLVMVDEASRPELTKTKDLMFEVQHREGTYPDPPPVSPGPIVH